MTESETYIFNCLNCDTPLPPMDEAEFQAAWAIRPEAFYCPGCRARRGRDPHNIRED